MFAQWESSASAVIAVLIREFRESRVQPMHNTFAEPLRPDHVNLDLCCTPRVQNVVETTVSDSNTIGTGEVMHDGHGHVPTTLMNNLEPSARNGSVLAHDSEPRLSVDDRSVDWPKERHVEQLGALASRRIEPQLITETKEAPRGGSRRLRWALIASDVLSIATAWALVAAVDTNGAQSGLFSMSRLGYTPIIVSLTVAMLVTGKLYRARMCSVRAVETAGILRACAYSGIAGWFVAERLGADALHIRTVLASQAIAFFLIVVGRMGYRAMLRRARRVGRFTRTVVLIGTGDEAYELQKMLADEPELGYRVVGVIGRANEVLERPFTVPYLGSTTDAVSILEHHRVTGVVIGASSLSFQELNKVVRNLLDAGVHVQVSGGLLGVDSSRLRANPIGREAAFYLEGVQLSGWQSRVKRLLDLVIGTFALLVSTPIILAFALWIKRTDNGPAFFKQQRIGRDGKPFTMWKLRTMVVDAESRLASLINDNERTGPLFKMENDPRFTRVGRIMDSASINELPQLLNVLRGEMSLVGPRPALEREVAKFNDRLLQRHRVKPGMTGLWQVESRDDPSFADYERCDLFYVENWSVRLDLMILAQTFAEVAKRATAGSKAKPADVHSVAGSSGHTSVSQINPVAASKPDLAAELTAPFHATFGATGLTPRVPSDV